MANTNGNPNSVPDLFNIDMLNSSDFDILNVPHDGLNFLDNGQLDSPSVSSATSLFTPNSNAMNSISTNNSRNLNNPDSGFLLTHYDTMLNQKKTQAKGKVKPICDHCRRRQVSCTASNNGGCINCESKGIKCTYTESPSNPQLKRNMGMMENNSPQESNLLQQQPSPKKLKQNLQILQYPRSSFYVGATSQFDPLILDKIKLDKIDQVQLDVRNSLRKVSPTVQFILKDDYSPSLSRSMDQDIELVESLVSPYGPQLIAIYFKIIHATFPILHKKVFLEKYSRSYKEFSVPLLATVYSLSCKYWNSDLNLSKIPNPIDVEQLNEIAIKTFYQVLERPRLSAVQAGLLLLQCRSESTNNWILMQQVVSLSEELGLGLDCSDWKLPKWERGLRRRLAWAIWIQEKWCALNESRISHLIINKNWQVKNISNDDFPELPPGQISNKNNDLKKIIDDFEIGKNLFKEMIQLGLILNEIMDCFYTNNQFLKIEDILKAAKPLQLKLRDWYHSLPGSLQLQQRIALSSSPATPQVASPKSSSLASSNLNGSLHLSYFAAEITLHRKIITSLASPTSHQQVPQELIKVCRNAAITRLQAVIEFIKHLNVLQTSPTNYLLNTFWNSSTTSNLVTVGTFAMLLYVTSKSSQESVISRNYLNEYRYELWKLGNNGHNSNDEVVGFEQARSALRRIDVLVKEIPGLNVSISAQNTSNSPLYQPFSAKASPMGISPVSYTHHSEFGKSPVNSINNGKQPNKFTP